MSLTAALLLRLLRRDWDPTPRLPAAIQNDTDWTAIVQTSLQHGVGGLLCRSLRSLPAGDVPQDIVDAAGVFLVNLDARGTTILAQLFDILDTLEAAGLPALPFKGPVLGVLAHASATIRPSQDIDVLVHRRDMDRAVDALRRLGYRSGEVLSRRMVATCYDNTGQDILFAEGRTPVEPHCAFAPRALSVNLDMDGLWERAKPMDVAGRAVLSLSPEDTLLIACLHGGKERWWRLLWVADIAALIHRCPALDWTTLMERAEATGVRRMLLLGLGLARDLFSSTLPVDVISAIEHDRTCVRLVEQSKTHLFGPAADLGSVNHVSLYHLASRERVGDRIRYIWRTVTTPRVIHYRMVRLPEALFFGYVAVKIVHDYLLLPLWNLGKGRWWQRSRSPARDVPA